MRVRAVCIALCVLAGCNSDVDPVSPASPLSTPPLDATAIAEHNDAVAAMGAFDYQTAIDTLTALVSSDPGRDRYKVDLAIAMLNRQRAGDETIALASLEDVLSREPDNARARYSAALLQLNAGNIEGAKSHLEMVVALDPADAYGSYYLGQSLMQLGQLDEALVYFKRAIALDPYLRSALYAGAQAARRVGDTELAAAWLGDFQRMEHNPRAHLAELKYTRMGPKAELTAIEVRSLEPTPPPMGPLFSTKRRGLIGCSDCPEVRSLGAGWEDGGLYIMFAGDQCEIYRYTDAQGFDGLASPQVRSEVPLSSGDINASLWGDVDSDGHVDVVLCRNGANQLWLGRGERQFELDDRMPSLDSSTIDGALFDADHDGDLDVLCVNDGSPCELINNNGDGTWQVLADASSGFPAAMNRGREVVVADFDGDLDTDVLLIAKSPPHMVWLNDRLWNWSTPDTGWGDLLGSDIATAVAADLNADGDMDIVASDGTCAVSVWSRQANGWSKRVLAESLAQSPLPDTSQRDRTSPPRQLAVADLDGDGLLDVLAETSWNFTGQIGLGRVLRVLGGDGRDDVLEMSGQRWTLLDAGGQHGPMLLTSGPAGIAWYPPGEGRFDFVSVLPRGATDAGQSMRSNASGVGTSIAARVGSRWTMTGGVRNTAGPGQNLQPISIGLGGAQDIDFIAIDWTDGVYQTESHLKPGQMHEIVETQRQLSSCPVIFAWNGESMQFMTDCLGVGGLGFYLSPSTYASPRPFERVLLERDVLNPRDGLMEIVLSEPMQETCYLDSVVLESIDCPPGWDVVADERMGTALPSPTSDLLYFRQQAKPVRARLGRQDVTDHVAVVDTLAADPGRLDGRFIGRLLEPLAMEIEFDRALDAPGRPVLLLDAWVEYPYSQTMFAAWQANRSYDSITIEAQRADGQWVMLHDKIGYPAGMPRRSVFPLEHIPVGCRALRLKTDLELYIDAASVAFVEPCPDAVIHSAQPVQAVLESVGFPNRVDGPHRRPGYEWNARKPIWDTRTQRGWYDALGDVMSQVGAIDGRTAIFGTGDAIRCRFEPSPAPPLGWSRRHVLAVAGWCKDMDLMTRQGGTVEPVPGVRVDDRSRYRSGR